MMYNMLHLYNEYNGSIQSSHGVPIVFPKSSHSIPIEFPKGSYNVLKEFPIAFPKSSH
jgi:hypothetical protein